MCYGDNMTQQLFIGFMKRLVKGTKKKILFIVDNLRVHHGKKVQKWLSAHADQIEVFYTSPYSPEINPDEYLNHNLKQSVHSGVLPRNTADLTKKTHSFIAWQDMRGINSVSSLHWLVVDERYQRIGLGRALCTAVMNIYAERQGLPVYIHTQPWSWKAILLYISLGFKLQKTDTFSHYENEYEKAMIELRKITTPEQYELLKQSSEE